MAKRVFTTHLEAIYTAQWARSQGKWHYLVSNCPKLDLMCKQWQFTPLNSPSLFWVTCFMSSVIEKTWRKKLLTW